MFGAHSTQFMCVHCTIALLRWTLWYAANGGMLEQIRGRCMELHFASRFEMSWMPANTWPSTWTAQD